MPVDEVTLAPNLEAVLFTPAVGKRGRHVDAFQTYHDFYKDELHIPQRRFDAGRLPTAKAISHNRRVSASAMIAGSNFVPQAAGGSNQLGAEFTLRAVNISKR